MHTRTLSAHSMKIAMAIGILEVDKMVIFIGNRDDMNKAKRFIQDANQGKYTSFSAVKLLDGKRFRTVTEEENWMQKLYVIRSK